MPARFRPFCAERGSRESPAADHYRVLAIALGDQLLRMATRNGEIWTWNAEDRNGHGTATVPLTGMSHGASGIAVALLELHAATGRVEFLEAARGSFAYEDSLFDPQVGNWPDLRVTDDAPPTPSSHSYFRAWCHGARELPWRGCGPPRSTPSGWIRT